MGIKIQIIDSKETDHSGLMDFFTGREYQVVLSTSIKKALSYVRKEKPDIVFVALDLPNLKGMEVLKKIKKNGEDITLLPIVSSVEQGVGAMKLGADYYFVKPYNLEEVKIVIDKYLSSKYYRERLERSRLRQLNELEKSEMIAASKSMREIYQQAVRLAEEGNAPILISGEVGTEKELLAKIIHLKSQQFMFPLVAINCNDKSVRLLDTQLFGVQKGTDGHRGKVEKPHLAEGGTFFLYNLEYLAKGDQIKLLKFLKSKKFGKKERKGSSAIGISIIVAANLNLKTLVDKGKFNKELYQKISRRSISVSPLRKRSKEIIPLAMYYLESFSKEYGRNVVKADPEVKHYLESYDWPGNVNELRNFIEHAVIISQLENISMKEVDFSVNKKLTTLESLVMNGSFLSLDEIVTLYVNTVLKKVKGNKSKAAKILKVSRNTLKKKSFAL